MEKTTVYSLIADRWLVATLPLGKSDFIDAAFSKNVNAKTTSVSLSY